MFPLRFAIAGRLVIAWWVGLVCLVGPRPVGAAERPNIVLIMADDLGFSDLGCYGSEIETPNLDALASGGLRFNQFYNTAKCHSSRICLLTGLYMFQAGNTRMDRAVTVAEVLRSAGYRTAMAGKWHLDGQPTERGFERYFGHLSGSTNYFTGDSTFRLNGEKFQVPQEGFYTTDAITDYALEFLKEFESGRAPFFLYLAYNAPHYPLHVKEKEFAKYRDTYQVGWDAIRQQRFRRQISTGVLPADTRLAPRPPEVPSWESLGEDRRRWEAERMAAFAGMVDCLDQNIGRLVEYLRTSGRLDDTIILFCSDNGACPFERTKGREYRPWDPRSYWTYDVGWAHVGNTPFRKYKQNQHEGGISSPLLVWWSRLGTPPGTVTAQPGHLIDLMATCLELAGADYPRAFGGRSIEPLQGRSLVPIFRGETRQPHSWLYFQFSGNRAIRQGDMKLVRAKDGPWELYDLGRDRTELEDLVRSRPETAAQLEQLWYWVAENVERAPAAMRKRIESPAGDAPKEDRRKPRKQ